MGEQQQALKEEQELEKAEKEFAEGIGSNIKDVDAEGEIIEVKGEIRTESNSKDFPYTAEENQQILTALGFKRYEDSGVIKYNIRVLNVKIGVTFNETNPLGKVWAYKIPEGNENKEFLKNGDLKAHPLIQKYHAIQEGKELLPEINVNGKITEKRGKAIKVEIIENGETKEIFYGQGAVKKDGDGYFIPGGFSKATKDHEAKMAVPRDIRLSGYETQLEQAPVADITKEKEGEEKGESQPTEKSTMDEVIKSREETIANKMKTYLEKGREMVEQIFPELEQPQLSELSQDIATSMFIEDRKEARKERW